MKKDCLNRKKDLIDEKPSVVGVAEGSSLFNEGDVFLTIAESPEKLYWILDFSFLFHMFSVKEYFDTCQPCEKGTVNMANSTQRQVVGWE